MNIYTTDNLAAGFIKLNNKEQNALAISSRLGNIQSRDKLWNSLSKMALRLCYRYQVEYIIEYTDLYSVAYIAFERALETYSSNKASFSTYVHTWMTGLMRRYINNHVNLVRIPGNRLMEINRIRLGKTPNKHNIQKVKD